MKPLAIAVCLHHKPWLAQATFLSLALQDYQDYDLFLIYQKGDGYCPGRDSYQEYCHLAEKNGINTQLSPDDQRALKIARQFSAGKAQEIIFENDHALDSGAWYRFIGTGKWSGYKYTLMIQEGTLFTRETVLSALMDFVRMEKAHFVSSGHEKRRVPKELFLSYNSREKGSGELDRYHDERIREVFASFCRDEDFRKAYEKWGSDFPPETENHIPDVKIGITERCGRLVRAVKNEMPRMAFQPTIIKGAKRILLSDVVKFPRKSKGVLFHREKGVEWFGCSCQHLLSHQFLEKLSGRLSEYNLYSVLDIPFAGTPLEVIWGLMPAWLGYDKWFFDGIHRVRKDFLTYKREDDPAGISWYLNRYFRGKLKVMAGRDSLQVKNMDKGEKKRAQA